jgi:hypothetical protein
MKKKNIFLHPKSLKKILVGIRVYENPDPRLDP